MGRCKEARGIVEAFGIAKRAVVWTRRELLREVLAPYRSGRCPVSIVYSNREASCEIDLGEAWRVNLHEDLIKSLTEWFSPENVRIVYNETMTRDS